tara:strand:+ start:1015 stop:1194 length:180 start_codon:yes stop_codon:yes gene_type:complete
MNLGAALVLLKLADDSGFTVSPKTEPTPPTSKAGLRPDCGPGKKAILQFDQWICVTDFD